ncbi:hypothetical protein BGZ65_000289, partial [Modicella reniformis]
IPHLLKKTYPTGSGMERSRVGQKKLADIASTNPYYLKRLKDKLDQIEKEFEVAESGEPPIKNPANIVIKGRPKHVRFESSVPSETKAGRKRGRESSVPSEPKAERKRDRGAKDKQVSKQGRRTKDMQ